VALLPNPLRQMPDHPSCHIANATGFCVVVVHRAKEERQEKRNAQPNLYKIIGRKAGSLPDYNYSSAMKGAGFVWDEEKLEHFIASPNEVVPGNNMKPYNGLASTDDRTKVIAFLQSVSTGRP
jgi:cytochrome c2